MESINKLLMKEHGRLLFYLSVISNETSDDKLKEIFDKFKWNLQKHFFVEEKAIFNFYEKIKSDDVNNIFTLMGEHGDLLELMKLIEGNFDKKRIEDLKMLLIKHQKFEDEVFYPRLDMVLNENQREELIKKINEIIQV